MKKTKRSSWKRLSYGIVNHSILMQFKLAIIAGLVMSYLYISILTITHH